MAILHDSNEFFVPFACYCFGKLWDWSDVIITPQGLKSMGPSTSADPKSISPSRSGFITCIRSMTMICLPVGGGSLGLLGETLETHASNFFNGNYDRFTWFGLRPVLDGMMGPLPAFNPMTQQPLSLLVTKAFIPAEDMIDEDERAVSHLMMTEYIQSA